MADQLLPFGPGAKLFIACYLLSLVGIGWLGYRARREDSMQDFYLAGPGIGFAVLLLTLYSTQYSGNTLLGFTGKAYRIGYSWGMCIHFMTAIIVVYLFFAPRLHVLARSYGFITPADYLDYRFRMPALNLLATLVMVVAIANYLLAQLMAMGRAMEGLSNMEPAKAYAMGVITLAFIVVLYETLGGFRAVAWTDVIQGTVLLIGFGILLAMVLQKYGTMRETTVVLMADQPEKVGLPSMARCREWFSYIFLVGLGGALYPQSLQRIYAAKDTRTLRLSLSVMAFLPLTTALIAVLVGVTGAAFVPGLIDGAQDRSDTILTIICREIQQESVAGYALVVVLFAAVLAAIMSTADSVLLSISSMITKDVYERFIHPGATQKRLTRVGKASSWVLILILTWLTIRLREETNLVKLLDRKFDLLVQLSPAFLLGIHWKGMRAGWTLAGLVTGVLVATSLAFLVDGKIYGIHAGLYGLGANLAVVVVGSMAQIGCDKRWNNR